MMNFPIDVDAGLLLDHGLDPLANILRKWEGACERGRDGIKNMHGLAISLQDKVHLQLPLNDINQLRTDSRLSPVLIMLKLYPFC